MSISEELFALAEGLGLEADEMVTRRQLVAGLAAAVADLEVLSASRKSQLEQCQADKTALQADVARLQAELDACLETQEPPAASYPAKPPIGKLLWGAAVGNNTDPTTRHETPTGVPLSIRRTFWQWSQRTTNLITTAKADVAKRRLPWVSTKTPSWAAMGAGTHDAEIDQMLNALKTVAGPVWLTVHHEPEGGGGVNAPDDPAGPTGHVAMNLRVRQRMTALGVTNVALAPILMTYSWNTASGRNPDQWWADGIYNFVGVDHYVHSETTLSDAIWSKVRTWAAARNTDVAVGEWGMRGTNLAAGQRVRDWYEAAITATNPRTVALTAFDSNPVGQDPAVNYWQLEGEQLKAFQALMKDPRTHLIG